MRVGKEIQVIYCV